MRTLGLEEVETCPRLVGTEQIPLRSGASFDPDLLGFSFGSLHGWPGPALTPGGGRVRGEKAGDCPKLLIPVRNGW